MKKIKKHKLNPQNSLTIIGASWKEGRVGLEVDKSVYQDMFRILQHIYHASLEKMGIGF